MRKRIKTIPTLVGLIILLGGIIAGVLFIRDAPVWLLRASPEMNPKQVIITNVNDTSFSVSWITDGDANGFINYGTDNNLSFNSRDDRDQLSGKTDSFSTHHVTVKGLKPSTTYYFKIGSGRTTYDNNGQNYKVVTGPTIIAPDQTSDVAHGNVVDKNGNPAEGAIVYLTLADATKQSTLTKASGTWVIPLTTARSTDLASFVTYDKDASLEEIYVQGGQEGVATAVTLTKKDNPVPTITLGGNFDFRDQVETTNDQESSPSAYNVSGQLSENSGNINLESGSTESSSSATGGGLPLNNSSGSSAAAGTKLEITSPTQSEKLNTQTPEIIGKGPAGQTLNITVNSAKTYKDSVVINNDGTWTWTPPADLEPGSHTVTVTLKDGSKVSKTFTVLAKDSSSVPAFTATPSGRISPIPTLTPKPTLSQTPIQSPTPTPRSIATRSSMPSTESGIEETGITTPTFLVLFIGAIFLILAVISARKISLFV